MKNLENTMSDSGRGRHHLPSTLRRLPRTTGRLLPAIFGFVVIAFPLAIYLLS